MASSNNRLLPRMILIVIFLIGVGSFIAAVTNLMLMLSHYQNDLMGWFRSLFLLIITAILLFFCYKKSHHYSTK